MQRILALTFVSVDTSIRLPEKRLKKITTVFQKIKKMNIKRIFGALLTIIGVGGLIYASILFVNTSGGTRDIKSLSTAGILGLVFFIAGIGLVRTTKDES